MIRPRSIEYISSLESWKLYYLLWLYYNKAYKINSHMYGMQFVEKDGNDFVLLTNKDTNKTKIYTKESFGSRVCEFMSREDFWYNMIFYNKISIRYDEHMTIATKGRYCVGNYYPKIAIATVLILDKIQ